MFGNINESLSDASLASIQNLQTIHKLELYGRGANDQLQIIAITTEGSNGEGVPQITFTDVNGYPMPQVIVQEVSLMVHSVEQPYSPSKAIYQPQDLPAEMVISRDISTSKYPNEVMQVDTTVNSNITELMPYQPEPTAGSTTIQFIKTIHPQLQAEPETDGIHIINTIQPQIPQDKLSYQPKVLEGDKIVNANISQPVTKTEGSDTRVDTATSVSEKSGHANKSLQEILMEMLTEPSKQAKSRTTGSSKKPNNEAGKLYSCSLCSKVFKKESSYKGHYQTHFGGKPFSCDKCSTGFTTKWALLNHQSLHTGLKPFECDDCGKKFRRKYDLVVHQVRHTGEKKHKCEECHEEFKYRGQLAAHRRYTHNGEVQSKPFKCSTCEKSFTNIWKCRIHERIHSDERPFTCDLCDKAFRQSHHLKEHLVSVHNGIRPYACSVCQRSFSQRHKMMQHEARHAIEKPFKCEVCMKSFRQQTNLDTHKLIHLRDSENSNSTKQGHRQKVKARTRGPRKSKTAESTSKIVKLECENKTVMQLDDQEEMVVYDVLPSDDTSPVMIPLEQDGQNIAVAEGSQPLTEHCNSYNQQDSRNLVGVISDSIGLDYQSTSQPQDLKCMHVLYNCSIERFAKADDISSRDGTVLLEDHTIPDLPKDHTILLREVPTDNERYIR